MPKNTVVQLLPPDHLERIVHTYRYAIARQYATGLVLDAACGWGYGSAMLAEAVHVEKVIGLDEDETALWHARKLYPEVTFRNADLNATDALIECDTLVCVETIEHLQEPDRFIARAKEVVRHRVILSTPIVPTKHKNPYHLHDFTEQQVCDWFTDWRLLRGEQQYSIYFIGVWERK